MEYQAEGFTFDTEEEALKARKEAEGVRFICARNDMRDPGIVLRLYNGLIERSAFSTPVGLRFLEELRGELLKLPYIREEHLLPLPVYCPPEPADREKEKKQTGTPPGKRTEEKKKEKKKEKEKEKDYRRMFYVSTFFAVVFAAALLVIFIITAVSGGSVTILNYENSLIDRYEAWEEELAERERALAEREAARSAEPATETAVETTFTD